MKPFRFQKFTVHQSEAVFRVGTDGVLLGALANCNARNILEVGTGTGLISLMLAQRNPDAKILAVDIDPNAVGLAAHNFSHSPFSDRLAAQHIDFKTFKSSEFFNLIICNPPYFDQNSSQKDRLARQRVTLDFDSLIRKSSELLSAYGRLAVIVPASETSFFTDTAAKYALYPAKKINIYGIANGLIKRILLEFSFEPPAFSEEDFVIEKSPRVYSDQYLEATRAFHVFKA